MMERRTAKGRELFVHTPEKCALEQERGKVTSSDSSSKMSEIKAKQYLTASTRSEEIRRVPRLFVETAP